MNANGAVATMYNSGHTFISSTIFGLRDGTGEL